MVLGFQIIWLPVPNHSARYTFGFLHSPQIMVNLINIGDSNYLSGIYSAKTNAKTTRGIYGTSIAGSSPTYYLGGGFATIVGISTGF